MKRSQSVFKTLTKNMSPVKRSAFSSNSSSKRKKASISEEVSNNWFETNGVEKPTYLREEHYYSGWSEIDITKAVNELKRSENSPIFIVALHLYKRDGCVNSIQFFEIKSDVSRAEIINEIFKKMKVLLKFERVSRSRKNDKHLKYFGDCEKSRYSFIELKPARAYIYVGEKLHENEKYSNNYENLISFLTRTPESLSLRMKTKDI